MGVMKRLSSIFQAKSNAALNKMEDPRQTLDLSYEQQLDNLTKVRRAIADVATARKRVEIQAEQLKNQGDKLADQAKTAMAQGNEPLAREALTRREVIASQLKDLDTQHATITEQQDKLEQTGQRLQAEVEAFAPRKRPSRQRTPLPKRPRTSPKPSAGFRRLWVMPGPRCSAPRTRSLKCRPAAARLTNCWRLVN